MYTQRINSEKNSEPVHRPAFKLWLAFMPLFLVLPAHAKYGGGTGTQADPFEIETAEHLNDIGNHEEDWDKHFRLTADIDLSAYTGLQFNQIGVGYQWPFRGLFDGDGHTISNFTYHSNLGDAGLFGHIQGTVRNLGLMNVDVSGTENVGGLAGIMVGGTVSNCYVKGGVSGHNDVGGLIGRPMVASINNCYSMAEVSGDYRIGGLVGLNDGNMIHNCYANGKTTGKEQVGGLVGRTGQNGAVVASFWDIETSEQAVSAGGNGRTTAEMEMASTYFGWGGCGNEGVWTIDEGNDYPRLTWESKPGQPIAGQFSDIVPGSGTETDPYLISTAEQLNSIGLFPCEWDKHFQLTADIDLSDYDGVEFNRIGVNDRWPFAGSFDGSRHKISNFTYHPPNEGDYGFVGLFSDISDSATVKDLGVIDVNVVGSQFVGGLAGRNNGGTILNCYVTGQVWGGWRGGGLIGCNSGTVTTSWATASVSSPWMGGPGGLVGANDGVLSDCYAIASVSAVSHDYGYGSGGLVGDNAGQIRNCYAAGPVSGPTSAVGGLVGMDLPGTVAASFWDTQTTGQLFSAGGAGKTTAGMKTRSTFADAGWDLVGETANGTEDTWSISEGVDYPRLSWHIYAYAPDPPDGATSVEPTPTLSWMPSMTAERHDVYFGDSFADVSDGVGGTFRGTQVEAYFVVGLPGSPYPDGLIPGTTYYWRIDEHNFEGTVTRGQVWSFTVAGSVEETLEYQVSASDDDGYAFGKTAQSLGTAYLKIGSSAFTKPPYYMSGMVFRSVNIPQGAQIVGARLKIQSYNSSVTGVIYGKIEAEAADSSGAFGNARRIGSLPRTSASVNWDFDEPWSEDTRYESPDIAEVIQEVINRSGWSAGNSLALLYGTRSRGGYRNFSSYDRGSDHAPKLEITYVP